MTLANEGAFTGTIQRQATKSRHPVAASKHSLLLSCPLIWGAGQAHCMQAPHNYKWPFIWTFLAIKEKVALAVEND